MTSFTDNSFPYVLVCSTLHRNREPRLGLDRHRPDLAPALVA